jgi:hypothetical protein
MKKRSGRLSFPAFFGAPAGAQLDCFASLAMTRIGRSHHDWRASYFSFHAA